VRRRILTATVTVAVVGVLVLGIPLLLVGRRVVRNDELRRLDREADAIGFAIIGAVEAGRPVEPAMIRAVAGQDRYVIVTERGGSRTVVGEPPKGRLLAASITLAGGTTIGMQASAREADEHILAATALVAGLGVAGVAVAVGLAVIVARRLAAPLSDLAATSRRLGAGDFSARSARYGIAEADAVAAALAAAGERIEGLLCAEREFSANASHQLRTPLTALRLHVEELAGIDDPPVRAEALAALAQADRLEETITTLLAVARNGRAGVRSQVDVSALLAARVQGWRHLASRSGRIVRHTSPDEACLVLGSAAALEQAFQSLFANALQHGAGTIDVTTLQADGHVEVTVSDEGQGVPAGSEARVFERHVSLSGGSGVGLALARSLVEADGGRLDLIRHSPPVFRILLPTVPATAASQNPVSSMFRTTELP